MTPIEILVVEDDPGDVLLLRESFGEHPVGNALTVVSDGVEALAYLRREGSYAACPRPGLIVLDLNLPRKNGAEVLAEIKADPELRAIPVVVLTTSRDDEDARRAYELDAHAYITKPAEFDGFRAAVRRIGLPPS